MAMEVRYWSTMIDNVCHKCPQKSSVIVVGTHADLLKSKQLTKNKKSDLNTFFKMSASHQTLYDVVTLNHGLLYSRNKDVLSMSPPHSLMHHRMLAFLKERLPIEMHAISLCDLICLETHQDKFVDPDITAVVPALPEKHLIVFISSEDPHSSWLVLHKESILKMVNGALFADLVLRKYTCLASKTEIISTAVLKKAFPDYNCDMTTQFMVHYEIGEAVDLTLINTNMASEVSTSSHLGPLFFIPALVSIERPISATDSKNSFCWSWIVTSTDQFFNPCFRHVLKKSVAIDEWKKMEPHLSYLVEGELLQGVCTKCTGICN